MLCTSVIDEDPLLQRTDFTSMITPSEFYR